MRVAELPTIFQEALCMHEAFRRMGFTPEQIFLETSSEAPDARSFFVTVHAAEGNVGVLIGLCNLSTEEVSAGWIEAVNTYHEGTDDDLNDLWEHSTAARNLDSIVVSLAFRGVRIPAIDTAWRQKMN